MKALLQKKQNFLAILSVLLLFLFLLMADFYYTWRGYEFGMVRDAKNGVIYVEETVGQILSLLDSLSKSPVIQSGDSRKINTFLNEIGDFPQVTSLELANAKGMRWAGKRKDLGNFYVGDREFYQGAVKTGKPYITNVVKSKIFDKIEFIVSYPIYNEKKQLDNVFFAPVWNTRFRALMEKLRMESGGEFHVVDRNSRFLLCNLEEVNEIREYNPPKQFSVHDSNFLGKILSPGAKVAARETVNGTSWVVIVDKDVSVLWSQVSRKILYDLLIIVLVLMPVIIIFTLFITQINKHKKELVRSNKKLQSLATTDGLTGLLNHRTFQDTLSECIANAGTDRPLTLLMMDIDNFKIFNDQFGHQAGDRVLAQLGRQMKDIFKNMGIIARYGGEEFVVILPNTNHEKGLAIAQEFSSLIQSTPLQLDTETEVRISLSIGLASYPKDATDRQNLIKFADRALYKAKEMESNKVQMYYSVLEELRVNIECDQDLMKIIHTLNTIINAKDKYTYGHSERVMNYAADLARYMGLPQKDIESITIGAFLHDIGKVEIPGDILNKPGKLNAKEFEFIKKHPLIGAEIIKPIKSLEKAREFTLYHHERFDGHGYPFGLDGKNIPIYGRIAAVVDAFDAMTTNRPYQIVKSRDEALMELERGAGSQFDPEIVLKFVEMYQNKLQSAEPDSQAYPLEMKE